MTREAVSTADDTSPLHEVSRRLAERQVQTPPWRLEYWLGGNTMARLAPRCLGGATVAFHPGGRATMAHAYGGGTTTVLYH